MVQCFTKRNQIDHAHVTEGSSSFAIDWREYIPTVANHFHEGKPDVSSVYL